MAAGEKLEEIHNLCINCGRKISEHPSKGRFHCIILYGRECAWNPEKEFKGFVINTLKNCGQTFKNWDIRHLLKIL